MPITCNPQKIPFEIKMLVVLNNPVEKRFEWRRFTSPRSGLGTSLDRFECRNQSVGARVMSWIVAVAVAPDGLEQATV